MKKIVCLLLFCTSTTTNFAGRQATECHKKVPSLQAYAAMAVAFQRLPDENLKTTLPKYSQRWVNAGCSIIKHLTGWQHDDQLGDYDCPALAHYAIATTWITHEKALKNARQKRHTLTIQELIACKEKDRKEGHNH